MIRNAPDRFAGIRLAFAAALLAGGILAADAFAQQKAAKREFSWRVDDTSVALLNGGKVVWSHVHDRKRGKPFMRVSLLDGTELTRPWPFAKTYIKPDHVWHKSLWWSWKFINGINFWEKYQEGTDPVKVEVKHNDDGSARIDLDITYHLPGKPAIVTEKRVITIGAPDASGSYLIDWRATFKPAGKDDVVFNKNSYGGFALRMAGEYCGDKAAGRAAWRFVKSSEEAGGKAKKFRWMAFHGLAQNGRPAAIAIFSHPENPRYPALWQTRTQYPYLNPSFTCKEDFTLKSGESLTLRYGVLIHDGAYDAKKIESAWKSFAR